VQNGSSRRPVHETPTGAGAPHPKRAGVPGRGRDWEIASDLKAELAWESDAMGNALNRRWKSSLSLWRPDERAPDEPHKHAECADVAQADENDLPRQAHTVIIGSPRDGSRRKVRKAERRLHARHWDAVRAGGSLTVSTTRRRWKVRLNQPAGRGPDGPSTPTMQARLPRQPRPGRRSTLRRPE